MSTSGWAARVHDYLCRSAGEHPGLDGLLRAALGRVTGQEGRGVPFELECSFRLTRGALERRRYIVAWSAAKLGERPFDSIAAMADAICAPARVAQWLARMRESDHLPFVVTFGVAWADAPARRTARIYLEQRPLEAILGEQSATRQAPVASAVSLEWALAAPETQVLRAYHDAPAPAAPDPGARALEAAAGTPLGPGLRALLTALPTRFAYARSDPERTSDRGATALQLITRHAPLAALRPALLDVATHLGAPLAALEALLAALPDGQARVVSAGRDRDGQPHLTLYHGPARGGLDPPQQRHRQ